MKEIKRLPEAELAVMQEVWDAPEQPVPSAWVTERLKNRWKTTSILTFLSRLCEKGFLVCEKQGKMNFYTAVISQNIYREQESVSFLRRFYRGSVRNLVASLSQTGALTHEDLEELRDFLDQQEEEKT